MEKYTLIVTEKPDAALRIATALDRNEKPSRMQDHRMPYFTAQRDRKLVVVPALGHLYTVAEDKSQRKKSAVLCYRWAPRHEAERHASHVRPWIEAISRLAKGASSFIDACDYDVEGSIIGYTILRYACDGKENLAKRMKYSTLTKEELEESYHNMLPNLDFSLVEAGLTRHEVDWLYGINLSRALTAAARRLCGGYSAISTGRVQAPTLSFIVAREKRIRCFVPTPYWTILAHIQIDKRSLEAQFEKEAIKTEREANEIVSSCSGKEGFVEKIEMTEFLQEPPEPFDLGTLQIEAYRLFGYSPRSTSRVAQRLYIDALISYPRTNSQKLPPTIDYGKILVDLGKATQYRKLTDELLSMSKLRPNQGRKEDPAHPAVYPTGKLPTKSLNQPESKVWDLIVRRFMSVFAEPALRQSQRILININRYRFNLRGNRTLREGWLHFYYPHMSFQEICLPTVEENQTVTVKGLKGNRELTQPPPRYNPASVVRQMERAGIGTKATRAEIVQTLYNRRYVNNGKIEATKLGFEVLEILQKHCAKITSSKFTRELEARMGKIQTGSEKKEAVIATTIETVKEILAELRKEETVIGIQLCEAIRESKMEERAILACPVCHTGKLVVIHSRKTGKRFLGCTNYFKGQCEASFPLPQKGVLRLLRHTCHECGWPTFHIRLKGQYSWALCINPQCPKKRKKVDPS